MCFCVFVLISVEILSAAISHDPTLVRPLFLASHKHKQERGHDKKSSLLGRFIAAIAEGEEVGLLSQIAEMAIQLLDPDTMDVCLICLCLS